MSDTKLIKGILYRRKKVKGISCSGCIFENSNDQTCKMSVSIFDKCIDKNDPDRFKESYIIIGVGFYNNLKII